MREFCVRGVVKNGQVVLDVPLDLPDGSVVFVADHAPGAGEPTKPNGLTPSDEYKRNLLTALNRLDLMDDSDWRSKCEADRVAYTEKLILEIAGMRAKRPEAA